MGLPTTWVILSLIHLYWMDEVRKTSKPGPRRKAHKKGICGDDALLATTHRGAVRYKEVVQDCGGEASEGKHFESRGKGRTTLRGVFLEKLFEFEIVDGKIVSGRRLGAMPLKGVTSCSLPRESIHDTLTQCQSRGLIQLMALDAIAESTVMMKCTADYIRHRVPWLASFAEEVLDLTPGFPLAYGGYRWGKKTSDGLLQALKVRNSGKSVTAAITKELDPCWRLATRYSLQGKLASIQEGDLLDVGVDAPLTDGNEIRPLLPN
jgi:hypothetical protein